VAAVPPTVIYNDQFDWTELEPRIRSGEFHNVIISPGPGTPERPKDIGVCMDLLNYLTDVPILGVCLGFQALALLHGARVEKAPEPIHGRLSELVHNNHPMFRATPSGPGQGNDVVRYHSLAVPEDTLPPCLEPIAWTTGRDHALKLTGSSHVSDTSSNPGPQHGGMHDQKKPILMAIAHRVYPHYGVQYHPESIGTVYGEQMLKNFRDLTCLHYSLPVVERPKVTLADLEHDRVSHEHPSIARQREHRDVCLDTPPLREGCSANLDHRPTEGGIGLLWRRVESTRCPLLAGASSSTRGSQAVFQHLYRPTKTTTTTTNNNNNHNSSPGPCSSSVFWLDSATATDRGRFSFMGGPGGSLWRKVSYKLPPSSSTTRASSTYDRSISNSVVNPGTLQVMRADGTVELRTPQSIWSYLDEVLERWKLPDDPDLAAALPFDFWCGFVGYLGYELKAECGCENTHTSATPDACFILADRVVAIDHLTNDIYLLAAFSREGDGPSRDQEHQAARAWLEALEVQLSGQTEEGTVERPNGMQAPKTVGSAAAFRLRRPREQYLADVKACQEALWAGESYEICLTNALCRQGDQDAWELYQVLRTINPAPYAAFFDFGVITTEKDEMSDHPKRGLRICCSSPERFLRKTRGNWLEARPIKGTATRSNDPEEDARLARDLAQSEKDRAENLMIVDLLRNDLGRVCDIGTVHVPGLMDIESFSTVHQLVSTVRGREGPMGDKKSSVVAPIVAAFPGGSMTGAPKVRTCSIIDDLEGCARGPYSGSVGYISFNGLFDLNIVIRTAVMYNNDVSIGAGGAIVVQSDPVGEYEEMRLKARALMRAFGQVDGSEIPAQVESEVPYQK